MPERENFYDFFRAWLWKRPETIGYFRKLLDVSANTFCSWYTPVIFKSMRVGHLVALVEATQDPALLQWLLEHTQRPQGETDDGIPRNP